MNTSRHTCAWVMSYIWERNVTHINVPAYESNVTICLPTSNTPHIVKQNESCLTHKCVKSHEQFACLRLTTHTAYSRTSHVSHMILYVTYSTESHTGMQHTYEWVMLHVWMSHVLIYMNESCYLYEWVMSHIGMRHVTHIKARLYASHHRTTRRATEREMAHK